MSKKTESATSSTEFVTEAAQPNHAIQALEAENASLQEAIDTLTEEKNQFKDALYRAKAELDNTIKRNKNDVDKARTYGSQKLLEDIIPVVDSLELGLSSAQGDEDGSHSQGMQMTLDLLLKTLEKHGITQLDPTGDTFDPQFHEAMTLQPSHDHKPNSIMQVLQKGYCLKDRLIRPARVIVAKEMS